MQLDRVGTEVLIFTPEGAITRDRYLVCEKPDRKGHVILEHSQSRARLRVHHRRLVDPQDIDLAMVWPVDGQKRTSCPVCGSGFIVQPAQTTIRCADHGEFQLSATQGAKSMITAEKAPKTKALKPKSKARPCVVAAPIEIDFAAMREVGQVWTKSNVKFDHPDIEVKAHVLLITAIGRRQGRKMCFNSYDGTWGKRAKDVDLALFASRGTDTAGKALGYPIRRSTADEVARLSREGYIREI